jgi:hypothetical protein
MVKSKEEWMKNLKQKHGFDAEEKLKIKEEIDGLIIEQSSLDFSLKMLTEKRGKEK